MFALTYQARSRLPTVVRMTDKYNFIQTERDLETDLNSVKIIYLVLVALEAEASHIVHCNYMVDFASDASRVTVKTNSVSTMAVVYPVVSMPGSMLSAY